MSNWKIFHNYILLSAFAFKILIIGTFLTLASHNICWANVMNEDVNWSRLIIKQRKRSDEPGHHMTSHKREAAVEGNRYAFARKLFLLPLIFFLTGITVCAVLSLDFFLTLTHRYKPEKIFLLHCSLIR
ncbi:hypothetical protein SAMN04488505_104372 [Chitinophaga rupis]|uniref:Uncharacterized protein n=1 Tax=Chitinophaga rupis TaxID=573321 RepID=A0A1H7Y9J3_9BACT|nr:hypothetical protein [Chitinophaga rupis]SEM42896.1 hypothetical protein SAMN04488505_104372 [Chitinophaga rupis]